MHCHVLFLSCFVVWFSSFEVIVVKFSSSIHLFNQAISEPDLNCDKTLWCYPSHEFRITISSLFLEHGLFNNPKARLFFKNFN